MRPCLPLRVSVSRRFTRSTALKKRPRVPPRNKTRAMAMARWVLACSGAADQHNVALVGDEAAGAKIAHQALVDRCAGKVELLDVLCQGQLGDGQLIADGSCQLLSDLRLQQIADEPGRFVLPLDACSQDLVIGAAHSVKLQRPLQIEDLSAFHDGLSS